MSLPLSIFSIVFNGHRFTELSVRESLRQAERVVVVEGATNRESKHLGRGCQIAGVPDSTDGTIDVLRKLEREFGKSRLRVVYAGGTYWPNKTEMVARALGHCHQGILMQKDIDEFWPDECVKVLRHIIPAGPYSDAEFHCKHFWSGPDYYCAIGVGWSGGDPWRRAWLWSGERVLSHEPPRFRMKWENLLPKEETRALGLGFFHYSYADMHNVSQKEKFYGLHKGQLVEPMRHWRKMGCPQGKAPCGHLVKYDGPHPIDIGWMKPA